MGLKNIDAVSPGKGGNCVVPVLNVKDLFPLIHSSWISVTTAVTRLIYGASFASNDVKTHSQISAMKSYEQEVTFQCRRWVTF